MLCTALAVNLRRLYETFSATLQRLSLAIPKVSSQRRHHSVGAVMKGVFQELD
jgi:hypothetical protein